MAGGINALSRLLGKVDANNALVVALDGSSPISATRYLSGDGTAAAPAFAPANYPTNGLSFPSSAAIVTSIGGVEVLRFGSSGATFNFLSSVKLGWSTAPATIAADTDISRAAARALTLGPTTGVTLRWATDGLLEVRNFANSDHAAIRASAATFTSVDSSGNVFAGSASAFAFTSSTRITAPADGLANFRNNGNTSGVGLDFATDAILKVRTRAQTGDATLWALQVATATAAAVIESRVALTDGAGAGAGTITNAPAAGNPTKWIGINDNGTIRYVPAW